jgi:HNH endonuclease
MLTQARLKELLHYDPETGVFTWIKRTSKRIYVGKIAGSLHPIGYWFIGVDNHRCYAHRLAWFWTHGEWPKGDIDHIDGNRVNNQLANLRDVTVSVNAQNQKRAQSDNKTGFLGVSPYRGKFIATIKVNGKRITCGIFDKPDIAHLAYVEAKRRLHEGCTI